MPSIGEVMVECHRGMVVVVVVVASDEGCVDKEPVAEGALGMWYNCRKTAPGGTSIGRPSISCSSCPNAASSTTHEATAAQKNRHNTARLIFIGLNPPPLWKSLGYQTPIPSYQSGPETTWPFGTAADNLPPAGSERVCPPQD